MITPNCQVARWILIFRAKPKNSYSKVLMRFTNIYISRCVSCIVRLISPTSFDWYIWLFCQIRLLKWCTCNLGQISTCFCPLYRQDMFVNMTCQVLRLSQWILQAYLNWQLASIYLHCFVVGKGEFSLHTHTNQQWQDSLVEAQSNNCHVFLS